MSNPYEPPLKSPRPKPDRQTLAWRFWFLAWLAMLPVLTLVAFAIVVVGPGCSTDG